jgi:hypothetical protein
VEDAPPPRCAHPFPQGYHDLYYNPQTQVLGMVTGMGNIKSAAALALGWTSGLI